MCVLEALLARFSSSRPTQRDSMATGTSEEYSPLPLIDNSVYQLYAPEGGITPEVDIVFFHGLYVGDSKDAHWKAWLSSSGILWPRTLLGQRKLPKARILSVSYDSSIRKPSQSEGEDIYRVGENLVQDIIERADVRVGAGKRPVVLVGHSLGGMVIKSFLQRASETKDIEDPEMESAYIERINTFLANLRGVFFYATPHHGSRMAEVVSRFPPNSDLSSTDLLQYWQILNKYTERLNEDFRNLRNKLNIRTYGVAESVPSNLHALGIKFEGMVVEEASARHDMNRFYTARQSDHFDVCIHTSDKDSGFQGLVDFVNDSIPGKADERSSRS
ncbi:unnamed protein product [Calypogeia fissa]